jgi:hypothetical protein
MGGPVVEAAITCVALAYVNNLFASTCHIAQPNLVVVIDAVPEVDSFNRYRLM